MCSDQRGDSFAVFYLTKQWVRGWGTGEGGTRREGLLMGSQSK